MTENYQRPTYGRKITLAAALAGASLLTPGYAHAGFWDSIKDLILAAPTAILDGGVRLAAKAPFLAAGIIVDESKTFYAKVKPDVEEGKKYAQQLIKDYVTNRSRRQLDEQVTSTSQIAALAQSRLENDLYEAKPIPYGRFAPEDGSQPQYSSQSTNSSGAPAPKRRVKKP